MTYTKQKIRHQIQCGATLIEALVSILILSLGLLGMAGLQLNAISFQKSSWAQHKVAELTNDIAERMRSNPKATSVGSYNYIQSYAVAATANLTSNNCRYSTSTVACTMQQVAADDLSSWVAKAQGTLPGGAVHLEGDSNSGFIATAMYVDKDFLDISTGVPTSSTSCTSATSGIAWRSCCPLAAAVPPGVRCARLPLFIQVNPD